MLLALFILAILLGINGILAMSELAMMTARQSRLAAAAVRGSRGAGAALALAREPTRFLSTVQVGITLVGILAGAFGDRTLSTGLRLWLERWPVVRPFADLIALTLVVGVITYFSMVLGELVPKRLALAYPERIASVIARPLTVLSVLAAWPVHLLTFSTDAVARVLCVKQQRGDDVSEEDVRALVARAATTGVFSRQEHAIFKRLLSVGDYTVRELMVPRMNIVWIEESTTPEELRVLIGTSPYSHFPVCRGSLDRMIGVVHIKDLIAYGLLAGANFKAAAVAHKPLFVPETLPALRLLDQFKSTKVHVAFVVDEHGGTLGMLTLNDVVGALVGDIARRGEEPRPRAVQRADGSWLVDGRLPLHETLATLDLATESRAAIPDVSTAAGLVLALLGHIPTEAESTEFEGWILEVIDMDGTRIDQILARRAGDDEAGPRGRERS